MASDTLLDHIAVAVEAWAEAFPRYAGALGGRWCSGGLSVGFAPCQLAFAGGMRLEVLAPNRVSDNDFLRRFLDRNGRGAHHLTFKVPNLKAAMASAEAAGYRVVSVDLSGAPWWMEAFLHPKSAPGVVVQIVESRQDDWRTPPPEGFPVATVARPASLVHVGLAVPAIDDGLNVFATLLHGAPDTSGADHGSRWLDLAWPGGSRVRLIEPDSPTSPVAGWIGDRPGRVHHLAFSFDQPEAVPAATRRADGLWEVAPGDNLGVRLLLGPPPPSSAPAGPGAQGNTAFPATDQGTRSATPDVDGDGA